MRNCFIREGFRKSLFIRRRRRRHVMEENVRCKCPLSCLHATVLSRSFLLYLHHHQPVCLNVNVRAQNGTQQSASLESDLFIKRRQTGFFSDERTMALEMSLILIFLAGLCQNESLMKMCFFIPPCVHFFTHLFKLNN